jgi:hypothetical protein
MATMKNATLAAIHPISHITVCSLECRADIQGYFTGFAVKKV